MMQFVLFLKHVEERRSKNEYNKKHRKEERRKKGLLCREDSPDFIKDFDRYFKRQKLNRYKKQFVHLSKVKKTLASINVEEFNTPTSSKIEYSIHELQYRIARGMPVKRKRVKHKMSVFYVPEETILKKFNQFMSRFDTIETFLR